MRLGYNGLTADDIVEGTRRLQKRKVDMLDLTGLKVSMGLGNIGNSYIIYGLIIFLFSFLTISMTILLLEEEEDPGERVARLFGVEVVLCSTLTLSVLLLCFGWMLNDVEKIYCLSRLLELEFGEVIHGRSMNGRSGAGPCASEKSPGLS